MPLHNRKRVDPIGEDAYEDPMSNTLLNKFQLPQKVPSQKLLPSL